MQTDTQPKLTPAQQNIIARTNLLQTGIPMVRKLATVNSEIGQKIDIPLERMGIMTGVLLHFKTTITEATAAAVNSKLAPWNLVQNISYRDFSGLERLFASGYGLYALQCLKRNELIGFSRYQTLEQIYGTFTNVGDINTNIVYMPTAIGSAPLEFSLYVPFAYDPSSDLTGAILTQTATGQHFITVQFANALVNSDESLAPFKSTAGTITDNGISVTPYQFYIQPQDLSINNLPLIDLQTVYGIEGNFKSTQNIAVSQDCYINYPNNRAVLGALFQFENGNSFTLNETDIGNVTLLANSNTHLRELDSRVIREMMREICGGDLASGTYYMPHRRNPILTQLYANVQAVFNVVGPLDTGTTQFIYHYEVQYPSGSPLPGIVV